LAQAYVIIHCETGKEGWVIRNLKKIQGAKETIGVFSLYDIIVKVEAKDQATIEKIIKEDTKSAVHSHNNDSDGYRRTRVNQN
jgi:hypothetical protein